MLQHLRQAKERWAKLAADGSGFASVVLGNEACDLDSAACSFAYSALARQPPLTIPLLNIDRRHLARHTEVVYWLRRVLGADTALDDVLLFRDDPKLSALQGSGRLRLILVDHNELAESQAGLVGAVVRCVDHHQPSGSLPAAADTRLETVGSCASLVARLLLEAAVVDEALRRDAALLLYGAVMIDTFGLQNDKTTPADVAAAELLERVAGLGAGERAATASCIAAAKNDVACFGLFDLLAKDYKLAPSDAPCRVGVSTVPCSLQLLSAKLSAGEQGDLAAFCAEKRLHALVLLTNREADGYRRLLIHQAERTGDWRERIELLLQTSVADLNLRRQDDLSSFSCFRIENVARESRKKLIPLLRDLAMK